MSIWRIVGIILVFGLASVGWLVLGGVTTLRTHEQTFSLRGEVDGLWGRPHVQAAPQFIFQRPELRESTRDGVRYTERVFVPESHGPDQTRVTAATHLDPRRKGLMWYALYDIDLKGTWRYTHQGEAGAVDIVFVFPDAGGVYDRFHFVIDGIERAVEPENGQVRARVDMQPGQQVALEVSYASRGSDSWRYQPSEGVTRLEDFDLTIETDFEGIDFPHETLSPSDKTRTEAGWQLAWRFERVVTGRALGVEMPQRIQPGELAAALSLSAPISLLFFFLVIFVLDRLRNIGMHPINYLFLAGAFFAFHLLFAYSADRLPLEAAFALASAVSLFLVVTYLRLVVGNRFAFVEAALAQLVYLVGFSLAHFFEGFTGLTVTVLSILTLFLLMQWTGRINWGDSLRGRPTPTARPLTVSP